MNSPQDLEKQFDNVYSEFLEKLGHHKEQKRGFCFGYRTEPFVKRIIGCLVQKVFVLDPGCEFSTSQNVVQLKGDLLEKLTAFPDGTFSFVFSLWHLSALREVYRTNIKRILKKDGICGLLIAEGQSPNLIMNILKREGLLLKKIGFPQGVNNLRNFLEVSGFFQNRIWEGKLRFNFCSANECLNNFEIMGGDAIFRALPEIARRRVKDTLLKKLSLLMKKNELTLEYNYLGAISCP